MPKLICRRRRGREAITALGMIGPAAKDAIPTLEKLTEHDDPPDR